MYEYIILFVCLFVNCVFASSKCFQNDKSDYVECSNIGSIEELSAKVRSNWRNIKIVNDNRETFNMSELSNSRLHLVRNLDLSEAGRLVMSDYGFQDFPALESLNLSGTQIDVIKPSWFSEPDFHDSLNTLDISKNFITNLSGPFLYPDGFWTLSKLNIAHNGIKSIECESFGDMISLKFLDLSFNSMENIDFGRIPVVETLDLSGNKLSTIPAKAFVDIPSVETLFIRGNQVYNIEDQAFIDIFNLGVLDLSINNIENITKNAFEGLSKLFDLDLSFNPIKYIPADSFAELPSLANLNLSHNSITELTNTTFGGLRSLITLVLDYNNIHELPDNVFQPLRWLEHLYLVGNHVQSVTHRIFGTTGLKLKTLDISENNIVSLPGNFFQTIPNLDSLALTANEMTSLDANVFRYLTKLSKLFLGRNSIDELPPNIVIELNVITELYIDHNQLTFFPDIDNKTFPMLVKSEIRGNPWQCPCLDELLRFFTTRRIEYERDFYYNGQEPVCVATHATEKKCIKDIEIVRMEDIAGTFGNPRF